MKTDYSKRLDKPTIKPKKPPFLFRAIAFFGSEPGSRIFSSIIGVTALLGGYWRWNIDFQHSKERDYKVAMFQQKLRLYEELANTTARLAKADDAETWFKNRELFWALHFGPIRMTGNPDLRNKLKNFGNEVVNMNSLINQSPGKVKQLPPFNENRDLYIKLSILSREISDLCKIDLDLARREIDFKTTRQKAQLASPKNAGGSQTKEPPSTPSGEVNPL